jgi:hypothetical protein
MSYANVLTNSSLVSSLTVSELTVKGQSRSGSNVLTADTAKDIAVPNILATDVVLLCPIGTRATAVSVVSITAGTGFQVISAAGDTRAFNWVVISTV